MSTLAAAIAEIDPDLDILWVGQFEPNGKMHAIVECQKLHRRYLYPGLTAWLGDLPGQEASSEMAMVATLEPSAPSSETSMVDGAGQLSLFD